MHKERSLKPLLYSFAVFLLTIPLVIYGVRAWEKKQLEGWNSVDCLISGYSRTQFRAYESGGVLYPPKCDVRAELDCSISVSIPCTVHSCSDMNVCEEQMPSSQPYKYWFKGTSYISDHDYEWKKSQVDNDAPFKVLVIVMFTIITIAVTIIECKKW